MTRTVAATRVARLAWIGVVLLLAQGCSTIKLAYRQFDTILLYYANEYVSLDETQERRLREAVARFGRWHCEAELSAYASWLRSVNDDVQSGRVDEATVSARDLEVQRFWHRLLDRSAAELSPVLASLSDAQVEEFFQRLAKHEHRLYADTVEPPLSRRRELARRSMERHLERWVGSLTPDQ